MKLVMTALAALLAGFFFVCASAVNVNQAVRKEYTVVKVVKLLNDMLAQLQKEADADEEVYENMACWCETNDKAKSKAIADAETKLTQLGSKISELTEQSAQLTIEIEKLKEEIAKNKKALEVATGIRKKAKEAFNEEEKDMLQSIQALNAAIVVLSKHHSKAAFAQVVATVNEQMAKHRAVLLGAITPHEKRTIASLVQEAPTSTWKPYSAASGEIYGILTQMRETFMADLSQDQKDEVAAQKEYEELKAAKELEISTGEASLEDKIQLLATTDESLAQAKEDSDDTSASLTEDQQFLLMLKDKCSLTDQEWKERQATRQTEMNAVSKAISILTSDDARDLFSKVFNPDGASFLQEKRVVKLRSSRQLAADALKAVAISHGNPKLAALATRVRLDAFTKVIAAIDKMVTDLLAEQDAEVKHRDYCIDEFNKKELSTQEKTHEKENAEAKIDGLKRKIKTLTDEIAALNAEIKELDAQLAKAKDEREAEAKEFAGVVADQREAQQLLDAAMKTLEEVYKESLLQLQKGSRSKQAPPPGFATYEKSGAATSVMALLQHVIDNAKKMEQETLAADAAAQKAFEDFKKETDDAKKVKGDSVTDKTGIKAEAEKTLIQTEGQLSDLVKALEGLAADVVALHGECDFTMKNFDVRQEARADEIDALRQAKAYLKGMGLQTVSNSTLST